MTAQLNISKKNLVEGDTLTLTLTLLDTAGAAYDLSAVTKVWWTVKDAFNKPDAEALVALNSADDPTQVTYGVAGPGAGKIKIVMLPADTAGLAQYQRRYYDVQVLAGAANINTLVRGKIDIEHEVTDATT